MGSHMISRAWRDQRQRWTFQPLGHQGYRLRSYNKESPIHSGYMVAEVYKTLPLESLRMPLDHRALARLSTVESPPAFPPTLHSWHISRGPKIVRPSARTVGSDIGLRFIARTIVV